MSSAATAIAPATPTIAPVAELNLRADMTLAIRNRWAVSDITAGIRLWRLTWALGWLDIRLRYRGSMLGPFWLTISTGVMVGALGVLYSTLFKINVHDYLPFLALSQVLWGFLSGLVSEACTTFTDAEGVIRSVRMPFFVFSLRTLIRNAIVLGHNIVVIVVVFAVFSIWPKWEALIAIPAMLVWALDALALTLLLGAFCARFRDIQPIVNSVMQIAFFITPVIWKPEQLGKSGAAHLAFNPFYDLLEIVRGPILGNPILSHTWIGAIGYSVILCAVAWAFFVRTRGRITFWDLIMTPKAMIQVENLSVQFPLYHGSSRSLKKMVVAAASGRLGQDQQQRVVVRALSGINLHLESGDRLGLVGANGAGKTTLLRVLAGIYEPVLGRLHVKGSLNALLDPNLGMNVELTGRENILLRGLYNGLPRSALPRLEDDIAEFAELSDFIDLPVRIYSAGMVVRLGFALATAIKPQILLMDEWFLAGDATFMEKARVRLEEMVRGADILVLSSHQSDIVRNWCGRVLWLDQGKVIADGPADDVLAQYLGSMPVQPVGALA